MDQPTSPFPIRGSLALFGESWRTYKQRWKDIVVLQLVVTLITMGSVFGMGLLLGGSLTGFMAKMQMKEQGVNLPLFIMLVIGGLIAILVMLFITAWAGTVQNVFYRDVVDGKTMDLGTALKEGFHRLWGFVWTGFLTALVVGAGLLLFVIPGIIWGLRYFFAAFIYLSEGVSGVAALKRSRELTRGVSWTLLARVYVVMIVALLMGLLQLLPIVGPFVIAPFLTTPLLALLSWYLFREFQKAKQSQPNLTSPYSGGKKFGLVLPAIGFVLLFVMFYAALFFFSVMRAPSGANQLPTTNSYDNYYR